MDTHTRSRDPLDLIGVIRLLVFVQGAILVAGTIEAIVFLSFIGPSGAGAVLLTAAAAMLTLLAAAGIGRHSRKARRWTLLAETGVLVLAGADVVLALFLAGGAVTPATLVLRVALPLSVIVLLRRRDVRAAFAPPAAAQNPGGVA